LAQATEFDWFRGDVHRLGVYISDHEGDKNQNNAHLSLELSPGQIFTPDLGDYKWPSLPNWALADREEASPRPMSTFDSFKNADTLLQLCHRTPKLYMRQTFKEQARLPEIRRLKFSVGGVTLEGGIQKTLRFARRRF